jgi:segregation and condensation protein B
MPLTRRIEGLLMSADKPLGEGRLANWLGLTGKGREAQVREAIELLNSFYAEHDRAFRIDRLAGGWQLLTHPEISPLLDHVHHEKKRRELSPAQLETLSIVAWRQPVLRAEIDELRGVASQDHLRLLTEHRLVQIVGQAEVPGRPNLYGTSREFLRVFGLGSLDDLPLVDGFERPKEVPSTAESSAPEDEEGLTEEVEATEESASVDSTPA